MLKTTFLTFLLHWLYSEYEQRTLYNALVLTRAMLLRLFNCRLLLLLLDIKSNPNHNPNPSPTTLQHAVLSNQLNIVACRTHRERLVRGSVSAPFLTSFRRHCHRPAEIAAVPKSQQSELRSGGVHSPGGVTRHRRRRCRAVFPAHSVTTHLLHLRTHISIDGCDFFRRFDNRIFFRRRLLKCMTAVV